MHLPDFFIIGAMKAGTTSVYEYLIQHPAIGRSRRKEPSFFADPNWSKGIRWYEQHFPDSGKLYCDASTNYTKYPDFGPVAKRMHSIIPRARLIYMLRHPVDRAISQIHFMHTTNNRRMAIIDIEGLGDRHQSGILCSSYYFQISQFLEYFKPEQIRCVRLEDLIEDPVTTLNSIIRFLGLTDDFYTKQLEFKRYNDSRKAVVVRKNALHRYLLKANRYQIVPPLYKMLETPAPQPQLTQGAKKYIWDAVEEDLTKMEQLLGRSLDYSPPS